MNSPVPLRLPAPAKLNRFLHVLGRREDGYHRLESLFVFLGFGDHVSLSPQAASDIVLQAALPGVPPEQDLCWRAARLLQSQAKVSQGASIALEKRLPMGGGLGGGSSDAASVLIGLNRLWDTGLTRRELASLALGLGADLPFFVMGENALVSGIGEEFRPVTVPPAWYVVIDVGVACSTREVFSDPGLTRNGESAKIALFSDAYGKNDLQPVATRLHPQIEGGLAWLSKYGEPRMTGSGACVFAVFMTEREAQAAWSRRPSGTRGFVAAGLPRHPLRDWVKD